MSYLHSQTAALSHTTPVPAAQAHAAQIPLQSFSLPTFPPEAFSSGLAALILTADIKLDTYTSLLSSPFTISPLPASITSLTLELFSLGFPPTFLSTLARALPGLTSLTVYSGLLAGTTPESRQDAVAFLRALPKLRELHLLDVFGPRNFFADLAAALALSSSSSSSPTSTSTITDPSSSSPSSLQFLEISFTYRHSDTAFLNTLPSGRELAAFVRAGLVGLTLRIAEPEVVEEDEEDREGTEMGIMPAQQKDGTAVVARVVAPDVGSRLRVLDLTMFEVEGEDVRGILKGCGALRVLGLSLGMERGWEEVFEVLMVGGGESGEGKGNGEGGELVEVLELVGVPGTALVERIKQEGEPGLSVEVLERLRRSRWPALRSVKVSILRTEVELWSREGEGWKKQDLI